MVDSKLSIDLLAQTLDPMLVLFPENLDSQDAAICSC